MEMGPGDQIGQYKLETLLGEGGMGVVYRALDTKLNRPVAVKFLSNELADAPARRRFQREAQTASALNHPHILTVFDAGEQEGRQYLVMEFVDGGTFKAWLRSEKRAWRQTIEMLVGVADALAAAHAAGILHRDVKPENILVARNGYAKLADFGLAKLFDQPSDETPTRTIAEPHTRPGMVVGTVAYMSPEQASGLPVDGRSDIFSFGIVLHEALAGQRPFRGASDLEVLQAILHGEPAQLGKDAPIALRMAIEKALAKDPAERYQTMREMVVDLRRSLRQGSQPVPALQPAAIPRRIRWQWIAYAGVLALAVGLIAGRWLWLRPAPSARNVQFQRITDFIGNEDSPAIAPDGKTVAFVSQSGGRRHIWVRLLAGGAPLQITHDEADHEQPRWGPDSSSLIYFSPAPDPTAPGTIWEVSALGGVPRRIAASSTPGDLSHDGRRIVLFQSNNGQIAVIVASRDGSGGQVVARLKGNFDRPRWSPDDRWIAVHRGIEDVFNDAISVVPSGGGTVKEVARGDTLNGMSWLPDSSGIVYSSSTGSTILYPPIFNLRMVRLNGSVERQLTFGDASYVSPDAAAAGKVAASRIRIQSDVWRFPISGTPQENTRNGVRITHQTGQTQTPSVSPDGKEVVYLSDSGGHGNLWVSKVDGSAVRQITFEHDPSVVIGVPVWSPAGDKIVFIVSRNGKTGEWLVDPDGSALHQLVERGSAASWSPDGRWLYYEKGSCLEKIPVQGGTATQVRCETGFPITLSLSSDGKTFHFAIPSPGGFDLRRAQPESGPPQMTARIPSSRLPLDPLLWQAVLSPNDQWLAAPLTDRGTTNLWMMPATGGPWRQLTDFGDRSTAIMRRISWAPDGKSIYAAVADIDSDIVMLDGLLP
jgi:eukaryotic-like serine/threonine-protein kinase